MEKIISFILAILLAGLNAYGVWNKAVLVCVDSALPENKDYTYLLKHYGVKKAVKTITDTSRIEDLYELLTHSKKIELKKPDNGCFCVYIKGDSSSINIIGGTKDMLIGRSLYETNRELLSKIYELSEFNYSRYLNLDDINIEDIDFVDIKSVMPNIFTTRDVLFYEFDDFFKGELKNSRIFCKPHILWVINALTTKRESENNNDMPIIDTRFVMDIHLKGGKDVIKIYGNESLFVVNNNVYKTDSIVSNLIWNTDYLRDNLGSVRVEVDGEGEVVRGADYSSTGVPMERRWRSPSGLELYGGKQYYGIRDLGWYDNSARTLESVMQRFTSMDPLCEKYPAVSPYAYCAGNPLRYIDPDGLDWMTASYEGEAFYFYDKRVKSQNDIYGLYGKGTYIKYLGESSVDVLGGSADGGFRTIGLVADGSYSIDGVGYDTEYNETGVLHIGGDMYTDMETVNRNLYGSYLGADNPELAGQGYSYAVPPTDYQDYAAFIYDNDYDKVNANGISGVMDVKTQQADIRLTANLLKYRTKASSFGAKFWGNSAIVVFSSLAELKRKYMYGEYGD